MLHRSLSYFTVPCQPSWRGTFAWNAGSGWDVGSLSDTWSTLCQNQGVHHGNPYRKNKAGSFPFPCRRARRGVVVGSWRTAGLEVLFQPRSCPAVGFQNRWSGEHPDPLGGAYGHPTGAGFQASPGEGGGRGTESLAGAGLALDRTLSVPACGKEDGSDALSAGTDPSNCSKVDGTLLSWIVGRGVLVVLESAISHAYPRITAKTHRIPSYIPSPISPLYVKGVRVIHPVLQSIQDRSVSVQSILENHLGDSGWLQFFSVSIVVKPTRGACLVNPPVLVEGGIVSRFGNGSRVWASKYGLAIAVGDSFGYCVDSMDFLCRAWVWTRGMALTVMVLDGHQMSSLT